MRNKEKKERAEDSSIWTSRRVQGERKERVRMRGLGILGILGAWAAWAFLGNACDQEAWAMGADLVRQDFCCKYQALALTWRLLAALGDAWRALAGLGGAWHSWAAMSCC